jgi:hypothetical protein
MERECPPVAVREQALLVVIELLARFGRVLEVRALDDGIAAGAREARLPRPQFEDDGPWPSLGSPLVSSKTSDPTDLTECHNLQIVHS